MSGRITNSLVNVVDAPSASVAVNTMVVVVSVAVGVPENSPAVGFSDNPYWERSIDDVYVTTDPDVADAAS